MRSTVVVSLHAPDVFMNTSILLLSAAVLLTGVFGVELASFLSGQPLAIAADSYMQKSIIWLLMMSGGALLYRHVLSKSHALHKGVRLEVSFPTTAFAIVCFFGLVFAAVMLAYAPLKII
ncbi:hypothetical protein SDC9_175182 [bioreactor metagenome]|uniref:Uncharacterized protein n=1 Tax=bioreactor metagenome TaxID=1076179 RepID=A0A645GLE8_9ZZZZ